MLFSTTTQYVVLVVALIAGWLLGLASHPGGKRWRQRYADERDAHAVTRRDQDARFNDLKAENAELARENARFGKAAPVTAATHAPRAAAAAEPAVYTRQPVVGERRGWFDWR